MEAAMDGSGAIAAAYVRAEHERPNFAEERDLAKTVTVPTIDLADLTDGNPKRSQAMQAIDRACREWGFFQVINHGVPAELIAEYQALSEAIFSMPAAERKEIFKMDGSLHQSAGFVPPQTTVGDAVEKLDWREKLMLFFFDNWESDTRPWPSKLPGYKEIVLRYKVEVGKLIDRLLEALSENLGLASGYLHDVFGRNYGPDILIMNYYPPCPQPELAMGLPGHTDVGGLTALLQDDVPGLQVNRDGKWVSIDPTPGAYVINLGDCLQAVTNGIYQSAEHRAVVNSTKHRISLPAFHRGSIDCFITPAPDLVTPDRQAVYRDFYLREYVAMFLSKGHVGRSILAHFLREPRTDENSSATRQQT